MLLYSERRIVWLVSTLYHCVLYVQLDLDGGAQIDAAWVLQATLAEEAAVVVPEAQRFPSMFS